MIWGETNLIGMEQEEYIRTLRKSKFLSAQCCPLGSKRKPTAVSSTTILQREGISLTFRTETHKSRNVSLSLVLHWKSSFCVFCPPMLINESYANCGKLKKHKIENEVGHRSLIISLPRDTHCQGDGTCPSRTFLLFIT